MPTIPVLGGYYRDRIPFYTTLDRDLSPENMGRRAAAVLVASTANAQAEQECTIL